MDELDVIARAGGALAPADEVTARHRAQLDAAVAGRSPLAPSRLATGRRPRLVLVAAAAAVVTALAAGALVASRAGEDGVRVASGGQDGDAPLTCGSDLPVPQPIPAPGPDAEPRPGPGPDAESAPVAGQFVQHWTASDLSMELRWPADDDLGVVLVDDSETPEPAASLVVVLEEAAGGEVRTATLALRLRDQQPACQWLQIRLVGHPEVDLAAIRAVADHMPADSRAVVTPDGIAATGIAVHRVTDALGAEQSTELVRATSAAPSLPPASACRAPADMTTPPNKGGPVAGSTVHPTPESALTAFLDFQGAPGSPVPEPTLPRYGYTRYSLPDGSFAFAQEPEPAFLVVVVHVVPAADGWAVARWETSGC